MTVALLYYYEEGMMSTLSVVAVIQFALVFALFAIERVTRGKDEED